MKNTLSVEEALQHRPAQQEREDPQHYHSRGELPITDPGPQIAPGFSQ
jgi:hypothetical protein